MKLIIQFFRYHIFVQIYRLQDQILVFINWSKENHNVEFAEFQVAVFKLL